MKKTIEISANDAISKIEKGKRIFISSGCAEPQFLVKTLVENADRFEKNEIVHIMTMGIAPYVKKEYEKHFRHNAFFIGKNVREAVRSGRADYTPIFLSEIPHLFINKQMPIHCALIQVSPPNNGYVSLGVSVDIVLAAVKNAEIVIAQVNNNMPETCGDSKIPLDLIDYLVYHDEPLIEVNEFNEADEVSEKIADNIAKLVKDGSTLQMGIGKIPNAILKKLVTKNDLGIHTEMFSDGIVELYKNGNITNKYKGINNGYSVSSFAMGTKILYETINKNEDFRFFPSEYVNDPFVISQNKNMVSINSAIEIDLSGQICSDSIGSNFYSGIGGQVDFVRGSVNSKGGFSIIALPSTAKNDTLSKIVPFLERGSGVVTSRGDVDFVVTEYGVAYLHGKSIRERIERLVNIAHPKFRDQLLTESIFN
ncbi:MAG: acetyl-CoA hydrolase/transferase C-terminal domain-containing protein [Candidatus Sericytochromatia bacterium]